MDQYLKTKLLPPRLGGRVLGRPRLLERMRRMIDLPATIVCANAGCGKTTLVNEFVRACGLPFVWQQIDASDRDLAVFFSYLVYGIKRLNPGFGELVLGYIEESEELGAKPEQLADVFINEVVEEIEEKTLIVLDDYHHVDRVSAIAAALDRVLQYLPDVLHIMITARSLPNLAISRLKSKGMVGIIDRQDLLFTEQEVAQLFRETFARPLPDDLVSQFHSRTEGWVTALQLIRQSLDRVRPNQAATPQGDGQPPADDLLTGRELALILRQSETDIFDYFADEVLQAEETTTRVMLGRASLLERIEPAILTEVFGDAQYREELLSLSRRNLFIARAYLTASEEEYRIHPLFRGFMQRWQEDQVGREEINRLHRRFAEYFAAAARWDYAIHHLIEAAAGEAVADVLVQHGGELARIGRFEVIKRAFDHVPAEALAQRPNAMIVRADIALMENDYTLARSLLQRARLGARELGQPGIEAEAMRGEAYIARRSGQPDVAVNLAEAALELAPDNHALRSRCLNVIGLCRLFALNNAAGAVESWRAALEEARLAEDERFSRIVLHNLGLPFWMEGDFNEALRWLSQITGRSRATGPLGEAANPEADSARGGDSTPFPQEAIGHLNVARLKIVQGKLDEAEQHLKEALRRCRLFNLLSYAAETVEAFGNLYRARGDFAKALAFYDEAARAYHEAGLSVADRELLDERATLFLQMGEIERARSEAAQYYQARAGSSAAEHLTALITRGRVQIAAGELTAAEASLSQASRIAAGAGMRYSEARAGSSLARALWAAGRNNEALTALRRPVELSIRYDYAYWLTGEAARAPDLFDAAIAAGIAPDYLKPIAEMRRAEGLAPSSPDAVGQRPELAVKTPKYDLAISLLGPIIVCRDPSEPMAEDAWRLSRSLHILCYIASRRNRRAPKEALVDVFWKDAAPETIAKNFHPSISYLRKALNSGQVIKKDFIQYRDSAYLLDPQYKVEIDTEEFERLLATAREAARAGDADGSAQLFQEAVKLYRGDFLEELYYDWVDELRTLYRDLYTEALKQLAVYYSATAAYDQAIRYNQMILQRDPYREDVHCDVMEAFVRLGNRAAAIEQFDSLRRLLRTELGVGPLPATVAKYESLIK